jgi:hypothetical protein
MSQSNSNESANQTLAWLIDLITNKLSLQSAALDDDFVREHRNSYQTSEDVDEIRQLFDARESKNDKISLSAVTRKVLGWKFSLICLLFSIFNALLR